MSILISFFSLQLFFIVTFFSGFISKKIMISFLRFSYAGFLIFSGGVKLIDPLGFSYKLQEYFEVFGMEFLVPFSLFISLFVILFEICLGLFMIYGFQIKKVMWGNLLLMLFFTFLTFFSAYFNKVIDCGCFGDFMKLDPWHSFIKDIHLLFVSIVLFVFQDHLTPLLSNYFQLKDEKMHLTIKMLFVKFMLFFVFSIYTISHLPFIDFRPYKIESSIVDGRKIPIDAKKDIYQDIWYYEIDGKINEYTTEDAPWSIEGAVFKDRVTKLISKGDEPSIKDFDLVNPLNDRNITDSLLNLDKVVFIISYDIEKSDNRSYEYISNYINLINESNIPIYGLSSSAIQDINIKLLGQQIFIPWLLVDQTTLKTIVRSNPGVIILEKGIVKNKWHWRDLPLVSN